MPSATTDPLQILTHAFSNLKFSFPQRKDKPCEAEEAEAAATSKPLFRPESRVHRNWRPSVHTVSGTQHIIHDVPSKGPTKADVLFMTGCGSDPLLLPRQINNGFSENGMRTLAARQIHRDDFEDNIDRNLAYAYWLLLSPESPVHTARTHGTPLFIVTNSSTKLLMDIVCLDRDNAQKVSETVDHFFDASPFYDTARSSIIHKFQNASTAEKWLRGALSAAYEWHAARNENVYIGDTFADRVVMKLGGSDKTSRTLQAMMNGPTHGEGNAYRHMGRDFIAQLEILAREDPDHPIFSIRSTSYPGLKDPAASKRTSDYVDFLKGENVTTEPIDAEHSPIKENPQTMRHILATMGHYIERYEQAPESPDIAEEPATYGAEAEDLRL